MPFLLYFLSNHCIKYEADGDRRKPNQAWRGLNEVMCPYGLFRGACIACLPFTNINIGRDEKRIKRIPPPRDSEQELRIGLSRAQHRCCSSLSFLNEGRKGRCDK